MKYIALAAVAFCFCASAPAQTQGGQPAPDVREAVLKALKDPESARFSDVFTVKLSDIKSASCGWVNSKNSYGGYPGKTRFVVIHLTMGPGKTITQLGDIESPEDNLKSGNVFDQVVWGPHCTKK